MLKPTTCLVGAFGSKACDSEPVTNTSPASTMTCHGAERTSERSAYLLASAGAPCTYHEIESCDAKYDIEEEENRDAHGLDRDGCSDLRWVGPEHNTSRLHSRTNRTERTEPNRTALDESVSTEWAESRHVPTRKPTRAPSRYKGHDGYAPIRREYYVEPRHAIRTTGSTEPTMQLEHNRGTGSGWVAR